jgi:hypothetical protein
MTIAQGANIAPTAGTLSTAARKGAEEFRIGIPEAQLVILRCLYVRLVFHFGHFGGVEWDGLAAADSHNLTTPSDVDIGERSSVGQDDLDSLGTHTPFRKSQDSLCNRVRKIRRHEAHSCP